MIFLHCFNPTFIFKSESYLKIKIQFYNNNYNCTLLHGTFNHNKDMIN